MLSGSYNQVHMYFETSRNINSKSSKSVGKTGVLFIEMKYCKGPILFHRYNVIANPNHVCHLNDMCEYVCQIGIETKKMLHNKIYGKPRSIGNV